MKLTFLKSKVLWTIVILAVVGGGWYYRQRQAANVVTYETQTVTQGDVVQTVEVTGQIKPDARIDLAFKTSGKLNAIHVTIGQKVKKGDVLAELDAKDLQYSANRARSAVVVAQANLSARLAGDTKESIQIAQASVDQARAAYDKAVSDLAATKQSVEDAYRLAQIAVDTAKKNVDNTGASLDQAVTNASDSARNSLQTALGSIQTGLVDGDAIIGVDNSAANDYYENLLGLNDRVSFDQARNQYPLAKSAKLLAESAVRNLSALSTSSQIKSAALSVQDGLQKTQTYLDYVQRALAGTVTNVSLTTTDLATKKATVDGDRTAVSAQLASVIAAIQAINTSELARNTSKSQLQNAYDTAVENLTIAEHDRVTEVNAKQATVSIQFAALASAKAALDLRKAPPRAVDVASLRAQVQDAQTASEQAAAKIGDAQIIAPADGIVTDILPAVGEQIAQNQTAVSMIATAGYTIEALVPEADIAKVKVDQTVSFTLDAFGDTVKFTGKVTAENPDQTKVQDAIYYKVYIMIDETTLDVKPGMTANLTVLTGERRGVIWMPSRALRTANGTRTVQLLKNGTPVDQAVELGLRGDEGRVEVIAGLTQGDVVILGETVGGK